MEKVKEMLRSAHDGDINVLKRLVNEEGVPIRAVNKRRQSRAFI